MADRPDWHPSWPEVPEGHEVVAIVDADWDVDTEGRSCRRAFGRGTKACGKPAAAVLRRGEQGQPWAYCPDHMYGRWVEEGFVMCWILINVGSGA
jgi:hypothetical protein